MIGRSINITFGAIVLIAFVLLPPHYSYANAERIFKDNNKAVVVVISYDNNGQIVSQGSGFIVNREGMIVTNYHVIADAAKVKVKLNIKTLPVKGMIYSDIDNDIAILKIESKQHAKVKLSDSDKVKVGEKIYVIGSPHGLENTISEGIVSGIRKISVNQSVIQISAPISPGSSGSPVMNENGEAIGIAAFIIKEAQNISFAIPINLIQPAITKTKIKPLPKASLKTDHVAKRTSPDKNPLYPIIVNGKHGYINNGGKIVIEPQYEEARPFQEELASIRINGKYGFIDKKGKLVIQAQYELSSGYSEGLAIVKIDSRWILLDKNGCVVPDSHEFVPAAHFSEGRARIKIDGKYGYIDKSGHIVIEPQFDYAHDFHEGFAAVAYGKVNKEGYGELGKRIPDGLGSAWGFVDKNGKIIIKPQYIYADRFSEGLAYVEIDGEDGRYCIYIDRDNNIVIPLKLFECANFSEGLSAISIGLFKYGYIDRRGDMLINPQFESADDFNGGMAEVGWIDGRYYMIDKKGKIVINPIIDDPVRFQGTDGLIYVVVGAKEGWMDRTGKFVWSKMKEDK